MTSSAIKSWQDVQGEVLHRIQTRFWKPGDLIPNEVDLAEEFGCARATVNRALRAVAEQGLIDRRRKAGTRVAVNPVRRATLKVPIIRQEIEETGREYSYRLIHSETVIPPMQVQTKMSTADDHSLLHLRSVHLGDGRPHAYEDRWINTRAVKNTETIDFSVQNSNEWLVQNAPMTHGEITFSASIASHYEANFLEIEEGKPLFQLERVTWDEETALSCVTLLFGPDYRMRMQI